ncbi:ABC transporter ATP-binding protein [Anaerotardibacter muris]|uniref:ABC transporter ATP-binding protein n=1 Tax=Anaerotardibacter muris TaxID=2941505 RepID=UPI002040BC59|nr:ABC transporter ATP-binding protein [Anaerotardibacter muris]
MLGRYLKPFGWLVLGACAFTFLQVFAELQLPDIMARIVDTGIYNKDLNYVLVRGAEMLAWAIGSVICVVFAALCASRAAMGFGRDVRAGIFSQVQRYSLAEFEQFGASTLITRNTNDVQQVERFLQMLMTMAVMTPVMFIGAVVMAFVTNAEMALLVFVAIPIIIIVVAIFLKIGMPLLRSLQSRIDAVNRVMREELQGVRVIRAYNKEDFERKRFGKVNRDLADTYIKVGRLMGAVMPLLFLIMDAAIVALYYFGAAQVDAGTLSAGEIMALVQYITLILMSLMMTSMIFALLPRTLAATERINAVLATTSTITDEGSVQLKEEERGRGVPILQMDQVSFRYPESKKDVLHDLTFELRPNTTTAFIGPTGSGKSSLINLIMRLYDVTAGKIFFDGTAIKDIPLKVLRQHISYTPQKSFLFTGTVAENLRFSNPDATDDELWQVLSLAKATEFITPDAGGLNFEIAQGGTNLSGGQRQRVAIARGLLRPADLYIFDDSFSALDFKTDAQVRRGIEGYLNDQSVLMVTQRVSVALGADQVILLNETGSIEACGTHDELFMSCPTYRELALSQLSEEELTGSDPAANPATSKVDSEAPSSFASGSSAEKESSTPDPSTPASGEGGE